MEDIAFEQSEAFLKRIRGEEPLFFSYSSLKLLDPNKYAPIDFLRYFNTSQERLDNESMAFLHYLFEYKKQYMVVDDLKTSVGKKQKQDAIDQRIPFVRRAAFESFPYMSLRISNIEQYRILREDDETHKLQFDTIEYLNPLSGITYHLRRYRHLVNVYDETIGIIKVGDFPNNTPNYEWSSLNIPLQSYIYSLGFENPKVYVITVSKNGRENVFKVSDETLRAGRNKMHVALNTFEQLKFDEQFYRSYDYYQHNNINTI